MNRSRTILTAAAMMLTTAVLMENGRLHMFSFGVMSENARNMGIFCIFVQEKFSFCIRLDKMTFLWYDRQGDVIIL